MTEVVVEELKIMLVEKTLRGDEQKIEQELVLKEKKVYVSKDKKLRLEVIWLHHDILVAGYREKQKIMRLVKKNYWWPEVTKDVEKYVEKYNMYQRMKNRTEIPVGNLIANEIPEKLWTYLTVDFITKLLLVAEKDVILVVCDRLLRQHIFVATVKETSVEGLARLLRDNVWKLHGLLESIISDRKLQFTTVL